MRNAVSRRTLVRASGVITAAAAVGSLAPVTATAAPAAPLGARKKAPASANGWPLEKQANHVSTVWTRPVSGTGLEVDIRIGDVEAILLHVVRRYHYEVEQLPRVDLAGWQRIDGLKKSEPESNLASGTAVRIRPGAGASGSLFPLQVLTVRDILADCEGVVRWGGDDDPVDESLFYIDRGPDDASVRELADRLRLAEATPGEGAGVMVDVLAPSRRDRAKRLVKEQRAS
ncbi:hypothetical protein PV963_18175 [Streptomyces coeruleorubidus]|uniref:hypothetical protein n=1 Tax=Streptomyces coeruleorubidus TaxID=116188 RepID=UPI00237F0C52|nr:hypothetical protein [Streptomyces coeruleorubidus]WDV56819.1 hypothetical protein PV963_18175 [Streptomyces coeruleorubidus]